MKFAGEGLGFSISSDIRLGAGRARAESQDRALPIRTALAMKPASALAFAVVAAALCGAAHAVDVYKWKDSKGVVHYGDRPASGVAATTLNVPGNGLTPEDEEAANERLEQARAKLAEPTDDDEPAAPAPRRTKKAPSYNCTEAWNRYDASQACYASHRAGNGKGVSDTGMAACRPVLQPTCER